jgi:hypothetical protein
MTKIYKYLTNLYFHIWFIAKKWLNFFMDDLEVDYKIEKMKFKQNSLMSLLLSPLFIYLLNEICQFIFKYLNISL